ncbi:MAG: hypothetical protein AMXMBFR53_36550 [Gemmatimonadota bacterium]
MRELAGRLGMKFHGQISAWENGQSPSPDNLAKVTLALGVSGHWLLTGEGPMYPQSPEDEALAYRKIAAIVLAREAIAPTAAEQEMAEAVRRAVGPKTKRQQKGGT